MTARYRAEYRGAEPAIIDGLAWIQGHVRAVDEARAMRLIAHGLFRVTALPPPGCG